MTAGIFILVARLFLAAMFLASGHIALSDREATAGYFTGLGLEYASALAWGVGIVELTAGVLLVIGFQTRPAAAVLAAFTLAATWLGHFGQGGNDAAAALLHSQMLLKDVAVAGGLIMLALHGAGRLSIDAAWRGN